MIRYLKSAAGTDSINLSNLGGLLANISLLNNALTISNLTPSTSTTTGALIVLGGIGAGGNINIGGRFNASGNVSGSYGVFRNGLTVSGNISAYNVHSAGDVIGETGIFNLIELNQISSDDAAFVNLTVTNSTNLNLLSASSATIPTITTTNFATTDATASTVYTSLLKVDTIEPRNGSQINFGSIDKINISGGQSGYVLGTDGSGNLSWMVGPAGLVYDNGIERVGDTVGLTTTGVTAGTYNRVVVDEYGRISSGTLGSDETLNSVATRNPTTSRAITITNSTDSTDTETGALIVSGGVGVGGTITAGKIVSAGDIDVSGTLNVLNQIEISRTLDLNGADQGYIPIKFSPGALVPAPTVGGIEFDGNYFYITTNIGRQVLQTREYEAPITGTVNVRAVALYNVNISNPTQFVQVNGVTVNAYDDVILVAYDRILLSNQTTPSENGIYVWRGEGTALQRASDFTALSGVFSGTVIFASEGTLNGNSIYQIATPNPITVGTTSLSIVQIFNKNVVGISNLAQNASTGFIVKTAYGSYSLRSLQSTSSFISVTNSDGAAGNITITTSTVPVASGGTGRTSIQGYMRGTGTTILSSNTIPVAHITGLGTMSLQNANAVSITGGNITVSNISANVITSNTATVTGNVNAGNIVASNTITANSINSNSISVSSITVGGNVSLPGLYGNAIALGANSAGSLSTNAVSVSTTYNVTDTIALMNVVLGKLVPPPPPAFPGGQTIALSSLTTARMTNFTQTDNTQTGGQSVAGGTTVSTIRRSSSYSTSAITTVGPGDTGTVSVYKNGSASGSTAMTGGLNGTFGELVIANNQDYHNVVASVNPNFWYSFNAAATGTVSAGWNEVYITHSAGDPTNTAIWYYDSASPGTPTFTLPTISLETNVSIYSSTIPHFTTAARFALQFDINRLSGDTYPTSDTFITGSSGGAFDTPVSLTYSQAGISTPLSRNLYVAGGSTALATFANVRSGFGSSSTGPSLSCSNSYNTGTQAFAPGVTVLYKTGTGNQIEETAIPVNSVGTGSGNALRIVNPGSTDTPAYSASAAAFNSQTSTLGVTDATVVAAVLKHDVTNYSTGHLPVGPDLSSGRSGAQYFTFKFVRTVVSKFDIKFTGTIAGLWVALPGSSIDTTSTLNGWLTLATAYNGSGVPGAGAGGNGSNGAAIGGVVPLNSAQTNKRVTATFGTASSSSTATNEIYVRIKLTSGQTVTALSIEAASN
jgi:cytoskeletal protein CcmA (bactofilin family)